MNGSRSKRPLRFGALEVNLAARELRKHGLRVRLPGQSFCILAMLLEKPGEVVTREEMRQRLWPADTFVDFERGLNSAIKKLRTALGDSAESPRYIETLPRLGYRFIAPVEELLPAQQPASQAESNFSSPPGAARKTARRRWMALAGVAAGLLAIAGSYFVWSRLHSPAPPSGGRVMLAVLPFENLTGNKEQDFFSDGLTEEMITQLGRVDPGRLGVIARTSVMRYRATPKPPDQIGRELGVQYLLEGSIFRDAGKVRITAKLIQVNDQASVWSRQYEREGANLLALQDDVTQEIADEIQSILGERKGNAPARPPSPPPKSYEAYEAYLKGRFFWNKRTAAGFRQAVEYFQQAITLDPSYARAHAGLADAYAMMSSYYVVPQKEGIPKAREAALHALQLDESLAEAHTSLAVIAQNYDWDWQSAEKEYRRAIELDPNYATAHHWCAEFLTLQGRFDEAFSESERARRLDPLSLIIAADYGASLYYARQYDRAIEQLRGVLEMEPGFSRARMVLYAYVQKRNFAEALALLDKEKGADESPWVWSSRAYIYGESGQTAQAQFALAKLLGFRHREGIEPMLFVIAYVGTDKKDEALSWLQEAYAQHSPGIASIKVDPLYDPLRSDPRFQKLLQQIGLADVPTAGARTSVR